MRLLFLVWSAPILRLFGVASWGRRERKRGAGRRGEGREENRQVRKRSFLLKSWLISQAPNHYPVRMAIYFTLHISQSVCFLNFTTTLKDVQDFVDEETESQGCQV